ncbi:hypothetical protein DFH28DRAFT_1077491 [Melampsora americana]|nr:hypothetical protein DFH28DRAFT_1077491 [Melampsora americana]
MTRDFGVKDTMTDFFIKKVQVAHDSYTHEEVETLCNQLKEDLGERIFNPMLRLKGFDGHTDTPVETLHVVLLGITKYLFRDIMKGLPSTKFGSPCYNNISARWRSFNTKGLNIPPIIPNTLIQFYQSLVGKEFRTVLQTVPFVLFDYMTPEKRHVWTSLCLLASYIFQTDIHNMDEYLKELDLIIDSFLHLLISVSAQWVNKPKFHMLVHLQQLIQRFGPVCLFATEKFESFNGVLRHASVHSNSLSPGRDIANSFTTREMMRIFICGSSFFDKALHCRVVPGPSKYETCSPLPLSLPKPNTTKLFESFHHVRLDNGQKLEPNDFVLLRSNGTMAQVQSIWKVQDDAPSKCVLLLKKCVPGEMIVFYAMREILVTEEINVERILNVQHNCHEGNCQATKTHIQRLERKEGQQKLYCITHSVSNSYVLNSASHYSGVAHRKLSQYTFPRVTPEEWVQAITKGIKKWVEEPIHPAKKGPAKKGNKGQYT